MCPLCHDNVDRLLYRYHLESERQVLERIREQNPEWTMNDGLCSRCVDYYHTSIVMEQRMLPEVGPYFPVRSADDFIILPSGLRLDADNRYTGKGVTICFIDSDFYLHPDLTAYKNRVLLAKDITKAGRAETYFTSARSSCWHGTMTSVVCAGDGYLSNGLYKGIACGAELVLLKVQNDAGKITTENIVKAMQWVLDHHKQYNIRIVNMSLGDDEPVSYKRSEVDRLAGLLDEAGITVVAAAGNSEGAAIKPPANAPAVITVGGIDDGNMLNEAAAAYHSAYGATVDGILKPELVAHAIWVAAPILPGTSEQQEAEALYNLLKLPDEEFPDAIAKQKQLLNGMPTRASLIQRIQTAKYITPDYMHVDGTSFAAPLVSAVVAQLLEVNPELKPAQIREILFSTAKRIDTIEAVRQGFGVIKPRRALLKVLKKELVEKPVRTPFVDNTQKTIDFYFTHDTATQVSLTGSFNQWAQDVLLMEPSEKGVWKITIPLLPAGKYMYKFIADERYWLEDMDNPLREPDGFNGFNNILEIQNTNG